MTRFLSINLENEKPLLSAAQSYVHGYSSDERKRLINQAQALVELLHSDTSYPSGSLVLEAGCGVGAQTLALSRQSPGATIVSIDISEDSLAAARERTRSATCENVVFQLADLYSLPFRPESFDHVFVCFVLEHLSRPREAIANLKSVLKLNGTITIIEGDHGSVYFHPESTYARRAIQCLVDLQARADRNALIGRQLYPILVQSGFQQVGVSTRVVYTDASRPELVEGFTKNTFIAMVEGIRREALGSGLIDEESWEKGIRDLYRTAEADGTFCYAFFKAMARKSV